MIKRFAEISDRELGKMMLKIIGFMMAFAAGFLIWQGDYSRASIFVFYALIVVIALYLKRDKKNVNDENN